MSEFKKLRDYGYNTDNNFYTIAEIGLNHNGDIKQAMSLIDSASKTGVDCVKFQTYVTEKRVTEHTKDKFFDLFKKLELPYEAFKDLKEYAESVGLNFTSTPFDEESADYLEDLGVDILKIASFDVTNYKFLRHLAKKNIPTILSVGMADMHEIEEAEKILTDKSQYITLLHCISSYPTNANDANLSSIYTLKNKFNCVIGQSDHTNDIEVPLYAIAAGAQVIEKHYMIDENMECVDSPVSITQNQMTRLVQNVKKLEKIIGDGFLGMSEVQAGATIFRRHTK